ncbi:MAG: transposase [Bacteroidetes bacterium]|nr:transposase [Bacteroidota bacterium]
METHTQPPQNTSTEHRPPKRIAGRKTPANAPVLPPMAIKPLPETTVTAILDRWPPEMSLDEYMIHVQKIIAMAAMEQEVEYLCGARYTHGGPSNNRYQRYGFNPGAIRIRSEWVRMQIPRVQDTQLQQAKQLESYQRLRQLCSQQKTRIVKMVFGGLSQRNYKQATQECAESFGLSASTVSRIFKEHTVEILHDFEQRDLSRQRYVVVMMDATKIRNKHIMIGVGITESGTKTVLGFTELHTENAQAIERLLERMIRRGLHYDQGLLFVVDGAKGIHSAITTVFGDYGYIQRCTQHKRENIKGYLRNDKKSSVVERQLNRVYLGEHSYDEAKQELKDIEEQLKKDGYTEAANSLREGMEETLTLHLLKATTELRPHLRTTNIMESLNSIVKERYRKIRRWTSSEHCHRWIGLGLIEAEEKMQTIPLTEDLNQLQKALREQVSQRMNIHLS